MVKSFITFLLDSIASKCISRRAPSFYFRKKSWSVLSLYSWDNIAQVKSFCSVVQKVSDNTAQEKILFNVVLISLGQHCTGKILVQCCPRDSKQHCTGKYAVQCCLYILGTTWHK